VVGTITSTLMIPKSDASYDPEWDLPNHKWSHAGQDIPRPSIGQEYTTPVKTTWWKTRLFCDSLIILTEIVAKNSRIMPYSVMWCRVGLFRPAVSEEHIVLSSIRWFFILKMEATCSSETSVLARPTCHQIPEHGILHNDGRENLRSYIALTGWYL
jgi:hypothetical protein